MNALLERQSLQNAANDLGLIIFYKVQDDRRKKVNRYFANRGKETVSPVLNYENMNHFLLGWRNAVNKTNI